MVKKGFTLVEAIVSMMIVAIITIGAIPTLTKKQPKIDAVALRGQYACFVDDGTYHNAGKLMEWYFDERSPRTVNPLVVDEAEGCRLKLDQRPANYYIVAAGAGSATLPAQTATLYTPAISNDLQIQLGRNVFGKDTSTIIYNGPSAEVYASGGATLSSAGISPANIKTCKIVQGPSCAQSCQLVEDHSFSYITNSYTSEYKIRINGCWQDNNAVDKVSTLITFDNLRFYGNDSSADFNNVPSTTRDTLSNANDGSYYGTGYVNSAQQYFYLNFDFYNSSFINPLNELGYTNNILNVYNSSTKSKMSKIIDTISIRRKSTLTEFISNLNPGAVNNNGAVLILW